MGLLKKAGKLVKKVAKVATNIAPVIPGGGMLVKAVQTGTKLVNRAKAVQSAVRGGSVATGALVPVTAYAAATGGGSMERGGGNSYQDFDEMFGGMLPGGVTPGFMAPAGAGKRAPRTGIGTEVLSGNLPMMVNPVLKQVLRAPPGYTLVKRFDGKVVAVLKVLAYALGLRKRPTRSRGISSRDLQAARRVNSFIQENTTARKPKSAVSTRKRKR